MNNLLRCQIILCCLSTGWGASTQAQSGESVKFGEADLIPSVRVDYLSNSNAFLTSEGEISATGVKVSPSLEVRANRRLLDVKFGYQGDYANMSEEALNYDDHRVYGLVDVDLDTQKRMKGSVQISKSHEELGKGRTFGSVSSSSVSVEYLDFSLDGSYSYGALSAKGNITGGLLYSSRTFQNRSDLTSGADVLEFAPYGQFSYRISSATRALLELRLRSLNFDTDTSDRSEIQALFGLEFTGAGKTSGFLKLGVGNANYDDDAVADTNFIVVNTNLTYSITAYSKFSLEYSRQLDDSDVVVLSQDQAQTIDDSVKLLWNHQWSAFVGSSVYFDGNFSRRDCPTPSSQATTSGIEIGVNPRRWVRFGVGFANEVRDLSGCADAQNVAAQEYDRQLVNVFVRVAL